MSMSASLIREARRFIVVGIESTALNYAAFLILFRSAGASYLWASAIGYSIGLVYGYFRNRSWTFRSVIGAKRVEFAFYLGVYLLSLGASLGVLRALVEAGGFDPQIGSIFAIGVSTALNFAGTKFLVFHSSVAAKIRKASPYFTRPFWWILGAKALASFLFASRFMTGGFAPFIGFFTDTFRNPYDAFAGSVQIPFPYPGGMLFFVGLPTFIARAILPASLLASVNMQIFLLRLPVLLLDVLIYVALCYLLPLKEKKVLWFYFASPILFYINYFHGQLDIVPTAFLLLSLVLLFRGAENMSFAALGFGVATKTHILAAIPFYCVYLWRYGASIGKITRLLAIAFGVFILMNAPVLSSGFLAAVFSNPEQERLFNLFVPFGLNDVRFLVAPAAILFLFYKFASYRKLNRDALLLMLGLTYTVLISLVPPMQGWFYWSLPFLVYFFVKFRGMPTMSFWAMNVFYLAYFAFAKGSDVFASLAPLGSALGSYPSPHDLLVRSGANADLVQNVLFTALEASLLMTAFAAYEAGVASNKLYQGVKPFVFGIAGDSGVGKSRLASAIERILHPRNVAVVAGDDAHKWERGHEQWKITTHLNPGANRVHLDLEHALAFLRGESVERPAYDHATGSLRPPERVEPKRFVLFQGLLTFVLDRMRDLFHAKFYIEADEDLRVEWKLARDGRERNRTAEEVRAQIASRRADAERYVHPQKEFADITVRYRRDPGTKNLVAEYALKNSLFVDDLVEALSGVPGFSAAHAYLDLAHQRVFLSGDLSEQAVREIAFRLYPNVIDAIESQPEFLGGLDGANQLFFLAVLNDFYRLGRHAQ